MKESGNYKTKSTLRLLYDTSENFFVINRYCMLFFTRRRTFQHMYVVTDRLGLRNYRIFQYYNNTAMKFAITFTINDLQFRCYKMQQHFFYSFLGI